MRAVLLWTINFPAYGMLYGWTTHGRLSQYCLGSTDVFQLKNGRKSCWFDCHRRFLPLAHPYRRNKTLFRHKKLSETVLLNISPASRSKQTLIITELRKQLKLEEIGMFLEICLMDMVCLTIGIRRVYFGSYPIGRIFSYATIWMSCILRRTFLRTS